MGRSFGYLYQHVFCPCPLMGMQGFLRAGLSWLPERHDIHPTPLVKLNSSSTVSIVRNVQNSPQQGKTLGSRSAVRQRGSVCKGGQATPSGTLEEVRESYLCNSRCPSAADARASIRRGAWAWVHARPEIVCNLPPLGVQKDVARQANRDPGQSCSATSGWVLRPLLP